MGEHVRARAGRLVVIRRTIGGVGRLQPRVGPLAAEMLSNALGFAEAIAARYSVRRAGEPATMTYDRTMSELRASLARARPPRPDSKERSPGEQVASPSRPAPVVSRGADGLVCEPIGPAPSSRELVTVPVGLPSPATDTPLELEPAPHRASTAPAGGPFESPGQARSSMRVVDSTRAPSSPEPSRAPGFEPVPRHPLWLERDIVERVTRRIREELDERRPSAELRAQVLPGAPARPSGDGPRAPIDVRDLTDDVSRELERRAMARRERKGLV